MEVVIKKWGNSLGVRIPKMIANDLNLKDGAAVDIKDLNGQIIISPKQYNLQDMLKHIDASNIHNEIDTGKSVGNESW